MRFNRPEAIARRVKSALLVLVIACAASPWDAFAQGVASRGVRPTPRGKPSGIPFLAQFVDVARGAGLVRPTIYGEVDYKDYILETIGGGAAWLDYDADGWIDLLIMGGTRFGSEASESSLQLHRNLRDGTFEEVTESAGLDRIGWASSATVGDIDNDGFQDIFVTFWGQNALFRNLGDGSFADITGTAGLLDNETRWGAGSTFFDYDRDGHLDLFVTNYLHFDPETTPGKGSGANCTWKGVPVNLWPARLAAGPPQPVSANLGDGSFEDVTSESGIGKSAPGYGMTAVAADLDADGWIDLYVACDGTPSLLFRNPGRRHIPRRGLGARCCAERGRN